MSDGYWEGGTWYETTVPTADEAEAAQEGGFWDSAGDAFDGLLATGDKLFGAIDRWNNMRDYEDSIERPNTNAVPDGTQPTAYPTAYPVPSASPAGVTLDRNTVLMAGGILLLAIVALK